MLQAHSFTNVQALAGGISAWAALGYPIEPKDTRDTKPRANTPEATES